MPPTARGSCLRGRALRITEMNDERKELPDEDVRRSVPRKKSGQSTEREGLRVDRATNRAAAGAATSTGQLYDSELMEEGLPLVLRS